MSETDCRSPQFARIDVGSSSDYFTATCFGKQHTPTHRKGLVNLSVE